MQQLCFTALALPLVFLTLGDETAQFLQTERPAMSPSQVVELDDKKNAVRGEASSRVKFCLEKGSDLV